MYTGKTRSTSMKVRHLLKKEGFKVGHTYKGRICDCFSGGLEVIGQIDSDTFNTDDNVKIEYCGRTLGLAEDKTDTKELLTKVYNVLLAKGFKSSLGFRDSFGSKRYYVLVFVNGY